MSDNYLYLKLNRLRIPGFKLDVWLGFWIRSRFWCKDIYEPAIDHLVIVASDLLTARELAFDFIEDNKVTGGIKYVKR